MPLYFESARRAMSLVEIDATATTLELCSGSSPIPTSLLNGSFRVLLDASWSMLDATDSLAPRVCANAVALPFASSCFTCVLSLNGFIHPSECTRVLSLGGFIVVCWAFGSWTPMYRPWSELMAAFPPGWRLQRGRGPWGEFGIIRLQSDD
jgi:hypothetical protein